MFYYIFMCYKTFFINIKIILYKYLFVLRRDRFTFIYPIWNSIVNDFGFTTGRQSSYHILVAVESHMINIVIENVNQVIADRRP